VGHGDVSWRRNLSGSWGLLSLSGSPRLVSGSWIPLLSASGWGTPSSAWSGSSTSRSRNFPTGID
jgi:hypothetical protein